MCKPISQRIIASILLLNQVLASCSILHIDIGPLKQANGPVIAIDEGHEQPKVEVLEDYDLPVVHPGTAVIQLDEETSTTPTQQVFSNLPINQAIKPSPSPLDSKTNQLKVPVASQGNVPTSLQVAPDNKQQTVKPIHQPTLKLPSRTQLLPMITYPSSPSTGITKDQQQVSVKEKHQRMQQVEPVQHLTAQGQQEWHISIVQTLQNPIWKRYVLNKQINTTHLLPDTQLQLSPRRGDYQFARVQGSLQPLVPMLSLPTREGYRIMLVQDMGYWWSIVQDNRPGFSRNVVLPVLYPHYADGEELSFPTQHTVEALIQMPAAVQARLVHLFSRDRSLKNGFVYTGEEMGLVGGTGCNDNADIAKKQTNADTTDKAMSEQEKEARKLIEELEDHMKTGKTDKDNPSTLPGEENKAQQDIEKKIKKNIQEVGGTTPLDPTLKQDIDEIFNRIDKEIKEIKEEKKSIARYLVSTEKSSLISDKSEDMSAGWATNLINDLKSYKKELCNILASRRQELNNLELEAAYKKGSLSGTSNPHANSSSQSYLTNEVDGSGKIFSFIGTCKELFPELKQQLEESTPRRIIYPEWFDSILKEDTEHIKSKLNEIKQRTDSANEDSANKELEELRRQYSGEVQKLLELMKESKERELKFKDGKYFQPSLRKSNVEEVKHFLDFIKEELQAVDAKTPFDKEYKEDISSLFNDINREFKGIQEEMGGTEKCLSLPEKSPDINYEQEAENLELAKQLIKDLESYQEELCDLLASRRQELNNPQLEAAYQEVEQRKRASN